MKIKFAWYDIWIGAFYDVKKQILYICPLPMILLVFKFKIYYWYGSDLFDWSQLCKETFRDTGHTPDMNYADKYWKATRFQVIKYFVEERVYKIKRIWSK